MTFDTYMKINEDQRQKQFLRENSNWYKYLNRSSAYYKPFLSDMKLKYKLTPTDKINKLLEDINLMKTFLDVLK